MNTILFGKYTGLNFQQLLEKDIPYCQFINDCKPNEKTIGFKEFLKDNLPAAVAKYKQDKILKFAKNLG